MKYLIRDAIILPVDDPRWDLQWRLIRRMHGRVGVILWNRVRSRLRFTVDAAVSRGLGAARDERHS